MHSQARNAVSRSSTLVKTALHCSARGDYRLAEAHLREALKLAPNKNGLSPTSRPALWNALGMVCKYLGKFDKAEGYYRRAMQHAQHLPKTPSREFFLANLYHNLGGVEHARRRFSRAETYARKGLRLRLGCAKPEGVAVAADRAALAAILDGLHKYKESEALYRAALRTYRREYGADHSENTVILSNLGALCQATGRAQRAEFYYRLALRIQREKLNERHPDVAVTLNNLALLRRSLGKIDQARSLLKKALDILSFSIGRSHPNTIVVEKNYKRLGRTPRESRGMPISPPPTVWPAPVGSAALPAASHPTGLACPSRSQTAALPGARTSQSPE